MNPEREHKRREERKFKRISVRYGAREIAHRAVAQQLSASGLFLLTNEIVYARNSPIMLEIKGPSTTWLVAGIVRHSIKVHPSMARFTSPGMGVELMHLPSACRDYLASL